MEDEECLPENSSLKLYLQDLGFSDVQVTKNVQQYPSSIRFEVAKPKSKLPYVETIDEDVIDQISIIISTQMLFEEDISNVEKLLSNFKVVKNGMLKNMFKSFFGIAVIFLGLSLYWLIGHYAFLIVSSFYAYTAADYLTRKHFNKIRLKKLTTILQANFMLLKKTFKFIEENKLIEENNTQVNNSVEFMEGFDFYKNFKADFLMSVNDMINVFVKSTQELINKVPLYDYIENPEFYLCNNFNENYNFVSLSKLYEIYLLVQSEFLQRLILSLIPNIKLSNKDGFVEFNRILTDTCVSLLKIKNKLNKKFKFLFINGIHSPKTKIEFKLPLKSSSGNNYFNEFIFNLHETSKIFQNLLLKCRTLEENLTSDNIPKYVEQELVKIQSDINACQRNITDSFILLKKANLTDGSSVKTVKAKVQEEEEVETSTENLNKIMVGYTDLDPKIEDEIFEAYFANESSGGLGIDDWNLDDKLDKKLEKEYCKNVIKELKVKLVEKAKYWKKRERELLKKKGLLDENEEDEKVQNSDEEIRVEDDTEKPLLNNFSDSKMPWKYEQLLQNSEASCTVGELENAEKKEDEQKLDSEKLLIQTEPQIDQAELGKNFETVVPDEETLNLLNVNTEIENTHDSIQCFNRGFLEDLHQAREKIFKSSLPAEEEFFCASGEDSSSEGEPT